MSVEELRDAIEKGGDLCEIFYQEEKFEDANYLAGKLDELKGELRRRRRVENIEERLRLIVSLRKNSLQAPYEEELIEEELELLEKLNELK